MDQRERGVHTGLQAWKWTSLGHSNEITEIRVSLKKKKEKHTRLLFDKTEIMEWLLAENYFSFSTWKTNHNMMNYPQHIKLDPSDNHWCHSVILRAAIFKQFLAQAQTYSFVDSAWFFPSYDSLNYSEWRIEKLIDKVSGVKATKRC